jgi:hypothetical protein
VILSEDFENGIPGGWTVIDGDALAPRPELQLLKGWQGREDYYDTAGHVVVSPSWYLGGGKSNDWLITPGVVLGSHPCLSWRSYSKDPFFLESYEVRVALTPDTTSFLSNDAVEIATADAASPHVSAASLSAWAGQTVYIAFRQISDDKFVWALDDVQVTNVNFIDVGVHEVTYGSPEPGDTVTVRFEVANYGSDTITSFQAVYRIDGGAAKSMTVSPVSVPPNGTVSFAHDSVFISDSMHAIHSICTWTTLPNGAVDEETHNDTLCTVLTIGHPVGMPGPASHADGMRLFPNPCGDRLSILLAGDPPHRRATVSIVDVSGMEVRRLMVELMPNSALEVSTEGLAPGVYMVKVSTASGGGMVRRLIKR